ncbi:hypothetical protein P1S61_40125 [Streptomyces sp. ME08-AFT2]|uniref:hypothetical protein n=1 Tax=Streptomyces sp. B21-105 TaxID=3039417 RepID=UPI0029A92A5B|nr:hypothetical protein [Streptomyces sp. ME08-AFT2]
MILEAAPVTFWGTAELTERHELGVSHYTEAVAAPALWEDGSGALIALGQFVRSSPGITVSVVRRATSILRQELHPSAGL